MSQITFTTQTVDPTAPNSGRLILYSKSTELFTIDSLGVVRSIDGDMRASVYDPTAIEDDAFAMDNMVEGATTKILSDVERTNIGNNTTHSSSDGKDHSDVVLNNTHRISDGKDHSDVVLNNTHRSSDGKDHSDVVLNNTHRLGDGSDHADVAQNTSDINTLVTGAKHKTDVETSTGGLGNITLSGEQTLNGYLTSTDRVMVVEQTLGEDNGIYISDAGAWTRATDYDTDAEVNNGDIITVNNLGSTKHLVSYLLTTDDPITVGTTPLVYSERLNPGQATESIAGLAEIATQAEVDAETDDLTFITPLKMASSQRFTEFREPSSTGFFNPEPVLTINGGDNTKYDMSAGTLLHIDNSTSPPTETIVIVPAVVAGTDPDLANRAASFVSVGLAGTPVLSLNRLTPTQRRDSAQVGLLAHPDLATITGAVNLPQRMINVKSVVDDLIQALGFFSTGGNQVSGVASQLQFQKAAGTGFSLFGDGSADLKDQYNFSLPVLNPATFLTELQTGEVLSFNNLLTPATWDDNGVETAVPSNNNATISYIYLFPNNGMSVLKGQEVFSSFAAAIDASGTETVIVPSVTEQDGLLLSRIIMKKNATDTTDTGEVVFIPSTAISGGGGSVSTMQQAYDVSIIPQVLIDATKGAVTYEAVTGDNPADVFAIQDDGQVKRFAVTGEGDVTAKDVSATGPVTGTNLSGTNTGDQTSIVGITGTKAQYNTSLTDGDFLYEGNAFREVSLSWHRTGYADFGLAQADDVYVTEAQYTWSGTDARPTPTNRTIYIQAFVEAGSMSSGSFRIIDITNSNNVICEITDITSTTNAIYDVGTLSNLSTGQAVWALQLLNENNVQLFIVPALTIIENDQS